MRALVTGGVGFIGTNLIKRLLRDGYEVTSIDNYSTGYTENLINDLQEITDTDCELSDIDEIVQYKGVISAALLDTKVEGMEGGTGKSFDWGIALNAKDFDIPIILAGGSGTRIWPLSRDEKPKQLLNLLDKLSLLQLTVNRLKNKIFVEPIIITGEAHRFIVQEQLNMIGRQNCRIILEPFPKNTAAAISVATIYVEKNNLPSTLLILPSDHFIDNNN